MDGHRQLRGRGRKPEAKEEDREKKRLDDGMHENGKPAIGPDCERINALLGGREARPHLEMNLHRLSGKELPPIDLERRGHTAVRNAEGAVRTAARTLKKPAPVNKTRLWATPTR